MQCSNGSAGPSSNFHGNGAVTGVKALVETGRTWSRDLNFKAWDNGDGIQLCTGRCLGQKA
jgi:hypothetical protein